MPPSSNHRTIEPSNHLYFMRHALSLAARNLGQTWPNPAVGAVCVKDGRILGTGWTARKGRPHAEPQALAQAGADARGATLYVTLEPCSHQGQTAPCAQAIIEAGIAQVVVACRDPHPKVNGQGAARLQAAGIAVTEGVCEAEARALNEGFFSVVERGRPYVAVKIATTRDGGMVHPTQRWITGEQARNYGHLLRARYDAILTGSGTVLADDPQLTCRLPGLEDRSPQRVLLDRRERVPATARIHPAWVYACPLPELLAELAERGVTRLLVEAGSALSDAFIEAGLADRLYWFRAPGVAGGEGFPALSGVAQWRREGVVSLGEDILEIYETSRKDKATISAVDARSLKRRLSE